MYLGHSYKVTKVEATRVDHFTHWGKVGEVRGRRPFQVNN